MNEYTLKDTQLDPDDIYKQHQEIKAIFCGEGQVRFRIEKSNVIVHTEDTPAGNISCSMRKIPEYAVGDKKAFKLRAYVEKREFVKNGKGSRVAIKDFPGIVNWMTRVSEQNGFSVKEYKLISNAYTLIGNKQDMRMPHNAVDFEGILEVKDAGLFKKAAECGVGPAKSFGFGVMYIPA